MCKIARLYNAINSMRICWNKEARRKFPLQLFYVWKKIESGQKRTKKYLYLNISQSDLSAYVFLIWIKKKNPIKCTFYIV